MPNMDELVKQMQAVSNSLATNENLDDLSTLISDWAGIIEDHIREQEEEEDSKEHPEEILLNRIASACNAAKAFNPRKQQ